MAASLDGPFILSLSKDCPFPRRRKAGLRQAQPERGKSDLMPGALETLAEHQEFAALIAHGFVEGADALIVRPHHETDHGRPLMCQEVLGRADQLRAQPLSPLAFVDGQRIDPAAMAVEARHHGADQHPLPVMRREDGGGRAAQREFDVARRIVPRMGEPRRLPQGDGGGNLVVAEPLDHPRRARAAPSRSASAALSAWSARAFSTASGLARSTKLGLLRRPARLSRSFSAAALPLARRVRSASMSITPSSGSTKVASSTTIRAAAPVGASPSAPSTRARRAIAGCCRSRRALVASPASRTWSGSRTPGGTLSSARAARTSLTSRISQSISLAASGSSAFASAIGHWPTIKSMLRPPACHSSSVMKGMKGWSITRIWSKAQPATALVSLSTCPLMSSTY